METDDGSYHASPQTKGRAVHHASDNKTSSTRSNDIFNLPVFSEQFGLMGKIDVYRKDKKMLIEWKYQLHQIFQGQIYQLWAQMFCMREMGYEIEKLAFYEISTNKMIPVDMPGMEQETQFELFINRFRTYNPEEQVKTNPNKCRHCIYCNLCDRTNVDNVYS